MSATRQMRRHQERLARKGKTPQRIAVQTGSRIPIKIDPDVERLVSCAFYRYPPGHGPGEPVLHKGFHEHSALRRSLGDADPYTQPRTDEPGFWTSKDRFVDRMEAVEVGQKSGQVSQNYGRELLSCDVIWEVKT